MIFRYTLGASLACMVLVSGARANLLINGGLETNLFPTEPDNLVYASPTVNTNALPGWSITSGTIDVVPKSYFQSSQGNYSVDMVGTPGIGAISQTFATTAGTTYFLTFDLAINPESALIANETATVKRLEVSAIGVNGSTVLDSQIYSGTAGTRTFSNMQYHQQIFTFTANGSLTTLELQALVSLNLSPGMTASNIYTGPVIDNLDLETGGGAAPFPEPASVALLGVGSLLLLRRRLPR